MNSKNEIKSLGFSHITIIVCYAFAFSTAFLTFTSFHTDVNIMLRCLIADVVATLLVFFFSFICNNSSMYDPYWSLAVPFICYSFLDFRRLTLTTVLFMLILLFWSIRLTLNCAIHWKGLNDEDWRYSSFRKLGTVRYWVISLIGFHLMPTILVFLNFLPAYFILNSSLANSIYAFFGLAVMLLAVIMEMLSDIQMDRFQKTRKTTSEVCTIGLWGVSRHPNYLGEISFWWGLWITSMGFEGSRLYFIVAPIAMTVLFLTYSIPAMERRQLEHRPQYASVKDQIPMLLPLPGRARH